MNVKQTKKGRRVFFVLFFIPLFLFLSACDFAEKPAGSFEVATRGAYSAALSQDGSFALIGSTNHGASYWQVEQQERLFDWNHQPGAFTEITACAISANGEFALTANAQQMVLWNTQTGESLTYFNAPAEILSVSLSRSGKYALLGLSNFTAVLFDAKKGGVLRTFHHDSRVRSVHLSADSSLALTGADDHQARLWDVKKGKLLHSREHRENVQLVRLSPNNKLALTVSKYDQALVWSTDTGEPVAELEISGEALKRGKSFTAAEFSSTGDYLLTGSSNREVTLWNTNTMKSEKMWRLTKRKWMKPTGATVLTMAFTDKNIIAMGSNGLLYSLAY